MNVAAYEFVLDDIRYVLVDTPGFDDDKQSDGEILKRISDFLSAEHEAGNLLSGIIYLHPINRPRVQGSTMVQIRVFKEFCGSDSYHNVVLGTTFWETIDESEATPREHELFSTPGFLGDIKDLGATTARVRKDRQSCIELVQSFADNEPVALKIQKDMAAGAGGFNSSDAAVALAPEIHQLRLDHDRELEEERRKAQEEEARRAQQEAEEEARRRQIERDREEARQRERERVEREEREYQAWLWRQRQKEKEEEERKAEERRLEAARQARLQLAREAEAAKRAAELEREREAERRRQQAREEERRKQEQQEAERRKAALCSFTRKPMYPHSGGVSLPANRLLAWLTCSSFFAHLGDVRVRLGIIVV